MHDPDADRAAAFAAASGAEADGQTRTRCSTRSTRCTCAPGPASTLGSSRRRPSEACGVLREAAGHRPRRGRGHGRRRSTAAGVINQVGLVLRSSPAFLELEHQLADPAQRPGAGGGAARRPVPPGAGHVRLHLAGATATRAGAGTMLEHSIHDVDALEWLLGPGGVGERPLRARSTATRASRTPSWPAWRWPSGAQVSLTSVWHQLLERPSLRRLEVICEHAFLTLEHDVHRPGHLDPCRGRTARSRARSCSRPWPRATTAGCPTRTAASSRRWPAGSPAPHPDLRTALRAARVVDAVYRSRRARGGALGRHRPRGLDPAG